MKERESISQGEFEIVKIEDLEFSDNWTEANGKSNNKLYPLKETIGYVAIIQNTGTTTIDVNEFSMRWEFCPNEELQFKLIRPER